MNYNEVALAVLFLLRQVNIPLNAEQISLGFPESCGYTYMDTTSAIAVLLDRDLIIKEDSPTGERYTININGTLILNRLLKDIRGSLRKSLAEYASTKLKDLSLESQIYASCLPTGTGKNMVILRAFDNNEQMSDITLMIEDTETAMTITKNWKKHADEAISALYGVLLKDN